MHMFAIILDVKCMLHECVKTSKNKKAKEMTNLCVLVFILGGISNIFLRLDALV